MMNNKIYEMESNLKNNFLENNLLESNSRNSLAIKETFNNYNVIDNPLNMIYYPNLENNIYTIKISDKRLQIITNPSITLTLPEIKGKGIVAYKKYYPYHLIESFEIYYINKKTTNNKILYNSYDSEDILMNLLCNNNNNKYLHYNSGKNDEFCKEKEGFYNDCVIFNKRTIKINLDNIFKTFSFFPNVDVVFEIKLKNIKDIIYYNLDFENNSLQNLIQNFNNTNLNLTFEFINNIVVNTEQNKEFLFKENQHVFRKKKIIGQSDTNTIRSKSFKNCIVTTFYNKCKHFNSNNKFISVLGNDTKESVIVNNWVKKILKDLIIVTELDLTDNKNKKKLGFKEKSIFTEVINNEVVFNEEKKEKCEIYIELIPENHKVYYHRNILTFSRRFNKNNELNISNLFRSIKGIIFGDNTKNIEFNIESIKHLITIEHVSIPVNIWSHIDNTSTRDLRSEESKKQDFIYNNSFINGLDFLSKDKGYKKISIKIDKTVIESCNIENKYNNLVNYNFIKVIELDKNFYPNIDFVSFFKYNINNKLQANELINFDSLHISIDWNLYLDNNYKSLYVFEPHLSVYEIMEINFEDQEVIIKPL